MHYLLFYEVEEGYVERRAPFRGQHLDLARQAYEKGDLILAGALADPVDGAVLLFRIREAAEAFVKGDPYVLNGLVRSWRVRAWNTVVGDIASAPGSS
jgi:uncharacterized protein YciI